MLKLLRSMLMDGTELTSGERQPGTAGELRAQRLAWSTMLAGALRSTKPYTQNLISLCHPPEEDAIVAVLFQVGLCQHEGELQGQVLDTRSLNAVLEGEGRGGARRRGEEGYGGPGLGAGSQTGAGVAPGPQCRRRQPVRGSEAAPASPSIQPLHPPGQGWMEAAGLRCIGIETGIGPYYLWPEQARIPAGQQGHWQVALEPARHHMQAEG
jgi:hypothetical protein